MFQPLPIHFRASDATGPYTDDFSVDYSPLHLDSNWNQSVNEFAALSGSAFPTGAATLEHAVYRSETYNDNQFAEVKFSNTYGSVYIGPAVRMSAGGTYYSSYANTLDIYLHRFVGETPTELANVTGVVNETATMRLEAEGATLTVYLNDIQVIQENDTGIGSGAVGMAAYIDEGTGSNAGVANFTGGNL